MFLVSAEAKTSAWAPWVSCVTRSDEPANENSTEAPGLSLLELIADLGERLLQRRGGEHHDLLLSPSRRRSSRRTRPRSSEEADRQPGGKQPGLLITILPDVSTMTVVALTTATATLPGSRFSSRTASALISETTVNGPHCISTWAITVSVTTFVTSPANRLRAELATVSGSLGPPRRSRASTRPARRRRPSCGRTASQCADNATVVDPSPDVSSLTPSSSAASRTRIFGTAEAYRPQSPRTTASTVQKRLINRNCGDSPGVGSRSVNLSRTGAPCSTWRCW